MTPDKQNKCLYFGQYNRVPLNKVPLWYLAWVYGSFTQLRKVVEPDLRRRGLGDHDLKLVRKRYPVRGKRPTKQTADKCSPTNQAVSSGRRHKESSSSAPSTTRPTLPAHIARDARLKEGVVITGENFDPSACDGSCPF